MCERNAGQAQHRILGVLRLGEDGLHAAEANRVRGGAQRLLGPVEADHGPGARVNDYRRRGIEDVAQRYGCRKQPADAAPVRRGQPRQHEPAQAHRVGDRCPQLRGGLVSRQLRRDALRGDVVVEFSLDGADSAAVQ